MYNNESGKDLFSAVIIAGLGASVATSLAVAQGQNPLVASAITVFAIVAAVLVDRLL